MKTKSIAITLSCLLLTASAAHAVVLSFEELAPPGGSININPSSPYNESGFRITTKNGNSGVADSAMTGSLKMIGDSTDWFGFQIHNGFTCILTSPPSGRFNLNSLLVGPTILPNQPVPSIVDVTISGTQFGGGMLSSTFTGLTTATHVTLNWTDLTSFGIFNDYAGNVSIGLDDIDVVPVPEPSSICILLSGIIGIALLCRRRTKR